MHVFKIYFSKSKRSSFIVGKYWKLITELYLKGYIWRESSCRMKYTQRSIAIWMQWSSISQSSFIVKQIYFQKILLLLFLQAGDQTHEHTDEHWSVTILLGLTSLQSSLLEIISSAQKDIININLEAKECRLLWYKLALF